MLEMLATPVLLIVADDLGRDLLAAANTPNLDAIALESVDFPNVWSAPSCSPYRAQVMTGRYPHRPESLVTQVIQPKHVDAWALPASSELLPALISPSFMVGKWHLSDLTSQPVHPFDCGWDWWWGTNYNLGGDGTYYGGFVWDNGQPSTWSGYLPEVSALKVVDVIEAGHDAFIYAPMHAIHKPFEAPPSHMHTRGDLAGADDMELAIAMTEAADYCIGLMVSAARDAGYVVIVTTDNGTSGMIGGPKGSFEEAGLNTWLYISGPGIDPAVDETLVSPPDLYATITDLCNGSPAPTPDGYSLRGNLFLQSPPSEREFNFACKFRPNGLEPIADDVEYTTAIRDARWKLMTAGGAPLEFFDLESDPDELLNLWGSPLNSAQASGLRGLLEVHP